MTSVQREAGVFLLECKKAVGFRINVMESQTAFLVLSGKII